MRKAWLQTVEHEIVYKDCCDQYTIPYATRIGELKRTVRAATHRRAGSSSVKHSPT